jgi:lipid-binding SYLF domain-containing protein
MATTSFPYHPILATLLLCTTPLFADDTRKAEDRLRDSADLFNEVMSAPDRSIPQDLLNKSYCVVLIPGLKKGAIIIGAKYGKGYAVCRAADQGWGPPAAIRIEGGSAGFQAGFSSSDVVLLIMNETGMKHLMKSKFTIGADATAAIGPVGRDTTAQTDAMMRAEILSWSRSHGVFAGVSIDGATLRGDVDDNEAMYGKRWTTKDILTSGATPPPAGKMLIDTLTKFSMRRVH